MKDDKMNEIVKVTWVDAQRLELGMYHKEDFPNLKPIPCDIVGFKMDENEEGIIIAQEKWHDDADNSCKYVHVIPKCSIIKIVKLKEIKSKNWKIIQRTIELIKLLNWLKTETMEFKCKIYEKTTKN